MREAVIVASSRTPLAKSFRGSFNLTRPDDFTAHCIKDVLRRVPQLDPAEIEDVFLGCAMPQGSQGDNVARIASVRAGLPVTVAAKREMSRMRSALRRIASTAPVVDDWMAAIWEAICSVAFAVCTASDFTSEATTAKPRPASPARAAPIVALSASRLVCPAML